MKKVFISYDLRAPGRNYKELYDKLQSMGAIRVLESLWAMRTSLGPAALRDTLTPLLDSNDGLIVVRVGASAWRNALTPPSRV